MNCALDGEPGDERQDICRHVPGAGKDGSQDNYHPGEWHPRLNLVSITLVLVSGVVLLVLVLLLVARMRRTGWKCCARTSNIDRELPDRSAGVTRASAGQRAGAGLSRPSTSERQENLYLPLAMYLEPRQDQGPRGGTQRGTTPEAEPPPAYHDLFPAGYKFQPDKYEDQPSQTPVQSASKSEGEEVSDLIGGGEAVEAEASTEEGAGAEGQAVQGPSTSQSNTQP